MILKKQLLLHLILYLSFITITNAQRATFKTATFQYTRLPAKPLPKEVKTYCPLIIGATEMSKSDLASQYLNLDGFVKVSQDENPDLIIKVELANGFERLTGDVEVRKTEKTENNTKVIVTTYFYRMKYRMPCKYKIMTKNGEILGEEIISDVESVITYDFPDFSSYSAAESHYVESKGKAMANIQNENTNKYFSKIKTRIDNDYLSIPVSEYIYIGRAEGNDKKYDYSDLDQAYEFIMEGLTSVNTKNHEIAKEPFKKAIDLLNKALTEKDLVDKKARINEKVTGMINYNLALVYFLMNDFDNSEKFLAATSTTDKGYADEYAELLKTLNISQRSRFKANGLL